MKERKKEMKERKKIRNEGGREKIERVEIVVLSP